MKTGLGLVLASAALIAVGACASGGGGDGGDVSTPAGIPGAETLDPGESPRENEQTEAAENHLGQALSAMEGGDEQTARTHYQQAAAAADQAIAMDATNPLPWLQGGRANLGLENYEVADSMLARAADLRPLYQFEITPIREGRWIELFNEAQPLINAGDFDAAADLLADAHAIYQDRPEAMFMLGQLRVQQGRFDDAIALLREAVEMVNDQTLTEAVDSATLATWREQAAEVRPHIAQALMSSERYDEAADMLRELVASEPDNFVYRQNLANLYVQMELPDSAEAIYMDLIEDGSLSSTQYYQVGIGLYQTDNFDTAADAFEAAVTAAPRDRDAAEMWARSLQIGHPPGGEAGDTTPEPILQKLKSASERWLELDPHSQNAHVILAQTENRLGNAQRASQLVIEVEQLPVIVYDLQLVRHSSGGGTLRGSIQNATAEAGTSVTLEVTFYATGTPLGSESVTVSLPAQDASQSFEVAFEAEELVTGYTYEVQGV